MVIISKFNPDRKLVCNVCGVKRHKGEKYWIIIGHRRWHPKNNPSTDTKPRLSQHTPKWH